MGYFEDNFLKPLIKDTTTIKDSFNHDALIWKKQLDDFTQDVSVITDSFSEGWKDIRAFRLYYDGCNYGVRRRDGTGIDLRNPYCDPTPKPQTRNDDYEEILQLPFSEGIYFLYNSYTLNQETLDFVSGQTGNAIFRSKAKIINVALPYTGNVLVSSSFNPSVKVIPQWSLQFDVSYFSEYNGVYYKHITSGSNVPDDKIFTFSGSQSFTLYGDNSVNFLSVNTTPKIIDGILRSGEVFNFRIFQSRFQLDSYLSYQSSINNPVKNYRRTIITGGENGTSTQINESNSTFFGMPIPYQSPPPPKQEECCKMDCCPDNSNIETLLKILIKRVGTPQKVTIFDEDLERKGTQKADKTPQTLNDYLKLAVERTEIVNRLIGIENFPVTVPDTMITPFQDGVFSKVFKFIDNKKKRKIASLTEFIAWMSEQDSAVLGEFHQVIQFEDENKKAASVVLPNVAEALKEIVLLSAQMAKQNNVQTELIFKIAAETIATKAVASRGTEIIQDIQDYLDYPTERKTKTIPTAVSLPKVNTDKNGIPIATAKTENPKNFLKPGEVKFIYEDWTGSNSLHDQMLDLLQLAAMLRAIYYQTTNKE